MSDDDRSTGSEMQAPLPALAPLADAGVGGGRYHRETVPLARRLAQTFGRTLAEIIRARHLMEAWLEASDVADEDRAALVLVVDELVTNAVRHGRGSIELYVNASDTVVRIEVCDKGGGHPRLPPVERSRAWLGGRGLRLVDQLVDVWGTSVRPGRTVVWAQRTIAPRPDLVSPDRRVTSPPARGRRERSAGGGIGGSGRSGRTCPSDSPAA